MMAGQRGLGRRLRRWWRERCSTAWAWLRTSLEWWVLWFGAPVVALLMWSVDGTALEEKFENLTVDLRFVARAGWDPPAPDELEVVGITKKDLDQYGRWPWTREIHTDLLSLLGQYETPSVLALDFYFTEPEGESVDRAFADAVATMGNVVTGAGRADFSDPEVATRMANSYFTFPLTVEGQPGDVLSGKGALIPIEALDESGAFGFVDLEPDRDGVWRRLPLVVRIGDAWYPTLVTQTMMLHWSLSVDQVKVRLGDSVVFERPDEEGGAVEVPIGEDGMMALNWRGWWLPEDGQRSLGSVVAYTELLTSLVRVNGGKERLERVPETAGKIVLVGQTEEGLSDIGASPLDREKTPGVMTHATAVENILSRSYVREVEGGWPFVVWMLVAGAGLRLAVGRGVVPMWGTVLAACVVYTCLAFLVFAAASVLVPLLWPVVGLLGLFTTFGALRWHGELAAKRQVREVFAKIVPEKVMDSLMEHPESINLAGQRRAVAVLFSDIRSFTTISESLEEEALVEQLNDYFEEMVGRIDQTGGTLSKYIGDAIMAVWGDVTAGAPEELARNATRAALGMKEVLAEVNPRWEAEGKPAFHTGIGINFGEVMVGYIGSARHREFTVIGDAVNTAARLEGLTKGYGAGIAVGESVRELLGESFVVRTLGLIVVKGKTVPVRVYEVMAENDDAEAAWAGRYERAFGRYLERDFARAAEGFEGCLEERPGDVCCTTYAEACRELEREAPGEEWDGVVVMTSK